MNDDLNDDLIALFDCRLGDQKLVEDPAAAFPWMFSDTR